MLFQNNTKSLSFKKWLWNKKENRVLLLLSLSAICIQFIWFKIIYPYPHFIPDSHDYLIAAFNNYTINTWPIGYSKFLRLFSSFTSSHLLLVAFQYVFLQVTILYWLFSIGYLLELGKWVIRLLIGGSLLNPLLLYISNLISADALFAALSLIWITQLLWLLYSPSIRLLLSHASVLLITFIVSYHALYYPLISICLIGYSQMHVKDKMIGISTILVLLGAFIGRTQFQYYKATDTVQFSALGGWQLASNALYAYSNEEIPNVPSRIPAQFRQLHSLVNRHIDSLRQVPVRPDGELGDYYLSNEHSPLRKYIPSRLKNDSSIEGPFKCLASMSPLYASYGCYLIQQHPCAFIKHYVMPNLFNYYAPNIEYLSTYNMGRDTIDQMAIIWFGLKTNEIYTYHRNKQIIITKFFPIILATMNLAFTFCFICFVLSGGFIKSNIYSKRVLCWLLMFWISNMIFSLLASPIVLRNQLLTMVITYTLATWLISFIVQESRSMKTSQIIEHQNKEGVQSELTM